MIRFISILVLCVLSHSVSQAQIFDLGEIVITPSKKEISTAESPVSVNIIKNIGLNSPANNTVQESLQCEATVKVVSYGLEGTLQSVSFRGLPSTSTLCIYDGAPLYSPDLGSIDFSSVLTEGIGSLEIVSGPLSSVYGSGAVGGTVNIISQMPSKTKNGRISAEYGTDSYSSVHMTKPFSGGNTDYLIHVDYKDAENQHENSDMHQGGFSFSLENNHDGKNTFFKGQISEKRNGVPGVKPADNTALRTLTQVTIGDDDISSDRDYQKELFSSFVLSSSDENLKYSLFYHRWQRNMYQWNVSSVDGSVVINESEYKHSPKSFGVEILYDGFIGMNDIFTSGISFIRDMYSYDTAFSEFAADRTTVSAFVQDEIKNHKTTYFISARYDKPDDYSFQMSPSVMAVKKNGDEILRFSVSGAYRAPTLSDIYWPDDGLSAGNPDLDAEKSVCFEISREKAFTDLILKNTLYFQRVHDMIQWSPSGSIGIFGTPKWIPANAAKVESFGAVTEVEKRFNRKTDGRLVWECIRSEQIRDELINSVNSAVDSVKRDTQNVPFHRVSFSLNYIPEQDWNCDVSVIAATKIYTYYADYASADTLGNLPTAEKEISGYTAVNLSVSKKIEKTSVYVKIENLFDRKYATQFGNDLYDNNYMMPERIVKAGVSWQF